MEGLLFVSWVLVHSVAGTAPSPTETGERFAVRVSENPGFLRIQVDGRVPDGTQFHEPSQHRSGDTVIGISAEEPNRRPPPGQVQDLPDLISRMRSGDREAAAVFVTKYGSRIRRRIRGKLNPSMRRIFDSQEIMSTVGRRLDMYVRSGRLEAASEQQLWSLMFRIANNAVIDKSRVFRRVQRVEEEGSGFTRELSRRLRESERRRDEGEAIELEKAFGLFDDRIDKQILSLRLLDAQHCEIAEYVDLPITAVRKRWQKITTRLRERFAAELCQ